MKFALVPFLWALLLALCLADDIPDCEFEDTVDLTNAHEFPNGSFLYDNILIPPDQVDIYDYEEIFNGNRVYKPDHLRGCLCKNRKCIKFCCDPLKEDLMMKTRECQAIGDTGGLTFDMNVDIRFENGSSGRALATKDFTVVYGVPCASDAVIDSENNVLSKWEVFENGSLHKLYDNVVVSKRDYCLLIDESRVKTRMVLLPLDCVKYKPLTTEELINDISKAISVPFIILTLLIYAFIPELQNLHGKCFMSYLISLAIYYTIFSIVEFAEEQIDETVSCTIMGYVGYFFALGVFFWLNVISYDLFQSFRRSVPFRSAKDRRFLMYSAYAWGLPLCFTLVMVGLDYSNVSSYYKPGMDDGCWCDSYKWPAVAYFTGINLLIVLVDITFLSLTFYKIIKMQREIKRVMVHGDSKKSNQLNQNKTSFGLFLRLFLVMGITWIFEAVETIETLIDPGHRNPLYYVTDFLNAIIGVLIFICFVLNRKVLGLIKKRIQRGRGIADSSQKEEETMLNTTESKMPTISRRNQDDKNSSHKLFLQKN